MVKKNLIILGGGFAGFSCLKGIDRNQYDVKVISPRNHFLFTPLLASTTVGTIEFRSIIEPIRNIKNIEFYQAYCTSINRENKTILCHDTHSDKTFILYYGILIIAPGETTNTFSIPGVKENAYFLREVTDSRKIRIRVIDCFEKAALPGIDETEKKKYLRFVVCGGGPTGVEFAAELYDFIDEDVSKKYPGLSPLIDVILIEAADKLLSSFDKKLSEYTMKIFRRQKINVKTKSAIVKVDTEKIYLQDGEKIEYGLLVWAAGNSPSELVKNSDFPKDKREKIIVDDYLKIKGYDNIYSCGDCAVNEHISYPATAQAAQQEGKYLAKSLNRIAQSKNPKPFKFHNLGMLAYIGGHKALADTPQFKGTGFKTYLFWRSVYLTKLVSLKNKILVLFDWFKTFIFGRDVSNF